MTQPRLPGGRDGLDGVVGRGGMAEVYRARDIRLDRVVAVKTLREDLARDQTFQARFRREAQSAASLNHPSIVAVYDTGEDDHGPAPVPYIVMEYVDGRTVRDLLRDDRRLLPERALEITDGVLRALDYSHRNGIVHRDIKPANVMVTRAGDIKVMDFGIARAVSDAQATMTQTAQVIGTAQYLSPEQARGEYGGPTSAIPAYQYGPPGEGYEEERRGRRWWPWLLGILVVLGVVGLVAYLLLGGGTKTYAVPQVQNLPQGKAVSKVKAAHLVPKVVKHSSPTVAKGHVIGSSPPFGNLEPAH